ncbi:helix-turn-helix domain-containing protein [Aquirufa ecclesiirivi]|uniref:helix-turn-helix domain-containing protein n=1 Tax=Aquirufa ecclesiirivi TaxID=2715124 RepID=UPI001407E0AC|nr:helix-turn-helix transcriptional regulator [Aquirufa ecclesiirivi]NHC49725.1 helix-turn-helix transcriptional regulator [Aquirufa ecclesiirivi]
MKKKNSDFVSLDQFIESNYGQLENIARDDFEVGYQHFKLGVLLHEARKNQGLTQEELALKVGTTKSYISKIENDVKEVRLSTLKKIVEVGLGGQLHISIDF